MNIDSLVSKTSRRTIVDSALLRATRKASGLSIKEFSIKMGLMNSSSLLQYENGKKRISRFVIERLLKFKGESTVIANYRIPAGTLIFGQVHQCESCDVVFVRYNSRHRFHSHACKCRAWRKRKKEKNG